MYYLSELYGKIGQILAEHGDMPIVRPVYSFADVLVSGDSFLRSLESKSFTSQDFIEHTTTGEKRVKYFVVDSLL